MAISLVSATLQVYAQSCIEASKRFVSSWPIILGSLGLAFVALIAANLLSDFGQAGGFALGIIFALLLSFYYSWLQEAFSGRKIRFKALLEFDSTYFSQIISVGFLLWILHTLVRVAQAAPGSITLENFFGLAVVLLLNCLPEVLIYHRQESVQALKAAFEFTQKNWLEWYIPTILVNLPMVLLDVRFFLLALSSSDVLIPAINIIRSFHLITFLPSYLAIALGVVMSHWFMLFRLSLFKALESGGRRKRAYQLAAKGQ